MCLVANKAEPSVKISPTLAIVRDSLSGGGPTLYHSQRKHNGPRFHLAKQGQGKGEGRLKAGTQPAYVPCSAQHGLGGEKPSVGVASQPFTPPDLGMLSHSSWRAVSDE
jgi:hypothetical protein